MSSETTESTNGITNLQESFQKQQEKISALKKLVHKAEKAHGSSKLAAQEKVKSLVEMLKRSKAKSRQGIIDSTGFNASNVSENVDNNVKSALSTSHLSLQSIAPMYASTPQKTPTAKVENSDYVDNCGPLPVTTTTATTAEAKTATITTTTTTTTTITTMMPDAIVTSGVISGSEKMTLMRQQLEQNRLRIAQKATSKQHLEQLVTQLKVKFDNTQQSLANATELGKSMSDLSNVMATSSSYRERYKSSTDLSGPPQPFNLEKERIKFLENRCRLLEKQLEKKNNQREMAAEIVEARVTELEEKLMKKEEICAELENKLKAKDSNIMAINENECQIEREGPIVLTSSLTNANENLIEENNRLHDEIDKYTKRIKELSEVSDLLECSRCELSAKVTQLEEELKMKQESCTVSAVVSADDEIKAEMAKEIQQLKDTLNEMRQEKLLLEEKSDNEISQMENGVDKNLMDKIAELEAIVDKQKVEMKKYEEELMEKRIEINVLNANLKVMDEKLEDALKTKPLFAPAGGNTSGLVGTNDTEQMDINKLQLELKQLKQKLDDTNKVSIKMKLKCKQTEKELEKCKVCIKNLEEEKSKITDANDTSTTTAEAKLTELRNIVKERDHQLEESELRIRDLENSIRKFEQNSVIEMSQFSEQSRVKRELLEIQWEEQIKQLMSQLAKKEELIETKDKQLLDCQEKLDDLDKQKNEMEKKLQHYINENIELLDKIEKLSKSSSSAESIEIVERLTQQERAELEEYNKAQGLAQNCEAVEDRKIEEAKGSHEKVPECVQSVDEEIGNLMKLREESSELKTKIELFTNERKEVLDKMEHLSDENCKLQQQIECLKSEQLNLKDKLHSAVKEKEELEGKLLMLSKEKDTLAVQVAETQAQKAQLSQNLTSLQKSSEVIAALDNQETLFDKCERSLAKLNSELKAYRKANDKNAKFNLSKKLAKEAENAHTQLSELLQKVKEASDAVETVTVVETVVAVTAPNGKALAEYEQLTAQNLELATTISELRQQLNEYRDEEENNRKEKVQLAQEELKSSEKALESSVERCAKLQKQVEQLNDELRRERLKCDESNATLEYYEIEMEKLRQINNDYDRLINDKETSYEKQIEELTCLRKELENRCETYEKEMEILKVLNEEQKQELIKAYKEHELEMESKVQKIDELNRQIESLQDEVGSLKETSQAMGQEMKKDLEQQCAKLKESLKINKALVQEQLNELANKQDTIDNVNEEIANLYKTIEDCNKEIANKNEQIVKLENQYESNLYELSRRLKQFELKNVELERLTKDQKDQLNSQQQEISEFHNRNEQLEENKRELEQRSREQLEKLKKYAANLKKKIQQCQEYEKQIERMKNDCDRLEQMEQTIHDSEYELREKSKELERNVRMNEKLQQQLDELRISYRGEADAVKQLQKQLPIVESMEINVESIQEELKLARQALDNKSKEIEELKEKFNNAEHLHEQQQLTFQNELCCLQEKLNMKIKEVENLKGSLKVAQEQINDLEAECLSTVKNNDYENLTTVLADKTAKLEKTECELADLRNRMQEKNAIVEELQAKCMNVPVMTAMKVEEEDLRKQIECQDQKLNELIEELKTKSIKFEKSKAVIKERNLQIQRLQAQLKDYQEKLTHLPEEELLSPKTQAQLEGGGQMRSSSMSSELEMLKEAYNKLNEKYQNERAKFQETITRLETLHDGIQAKLQENVAYIETLEGENGKFKEKICRLEECVAVFEERRASMERKVKCINAEMQRYSVEHTKTEDELIYRLNMLSEHDDIIARRLLDSQTDKERLEERIRCMQIDLNDCQLKYSHLEKDFAKYKTLHMEESERERNNWLEQLEKMENELQTMERVKLETETKLLNKTQELDDLENQLDEQLQKWNVEKRSLMEQLERATNNCLTHQDDLTSLRETISDLEESKADLEREVTWLRMQNENTQQDQYEVQELRLQYIQDKEEIENMRDQINRLVSNHATELEALRTQIAELDTVRMQVGQNQTDDQVFIETENKRLTDLLAEKVALIENYQRQNLQLQLAVAAAGSDGSNGATIADSLAAPAHTNDEVDKMRAELNEKSALVLRLQQDLNNSQSIVDKSSNSTSQSQFETRQGVSMVESAALPTPSMFFATDASANLRTPFDNISMASSSQQQNDLSRSEQSPTIEDLQRNVSDLEKYAHDLEHKLGARNQRVLEYEERLRDLEQRCELNERELVRVQLEHADLVVNTDKQRSELEQKLSEQEQELKTAQSILKERENELARLQNQQCEDELMKKSMSTVEKQIITNSLESDIQPTLDMFFGNTGSSVFESFAVPPVSIEPVVEEKIIPRKAYKCQPTQESFAQSSPVLNLGVDWSDGWGTDEAETVAEAEHYAKVSTTQSSLISREKQLELELQDVNDHLKQAQFNLEQSEEQKRDLQAKYNKLGKKLKEYKAKIDELQARDERGESVFRKSASVESNTRSNDLDAAIEDELKNQMKALEGNLIEQRKQLDLQIMEKEKLLKRIDVLTAGNARMVEMKERQDKEVYMYQNRIKELQDKLKVLEDWSTEMPTTESIKRPDRDESNHQKVAQEKYEALENVKELEDRITVLSLEVEDLNLDRSELQALLDEERSNVTKAEQIILSLRQQLNNMQDVQLNEKTQDIENIKESYNNLQSVNAKLNVDIQELETLLVEKEANAKALALEKESLQEMLTKAVQTEAELSALKIQNEELLRELQKLQDINKQLEMDIEMLKMNKLNDRNDNNLNNVNDKDELSILLLEKDSEIEHLKQRINDLMNEDQTEKLVLEILTKNQEIHLLKMQMKTLEDDKQEIENLLNRQHEYKEEETQTTLDVGGGENDSNEMKLQKQLEELQKEKHQMQMELEVLNHHVLNSINLEDQLKALSLELDAKNQQISQLQISGSNSAVNYAELNEHWEAIIEQRCSDIAKVWQDHLAKKEHDHKSIEAQLREEIAILRNNNATINNDNESRKATSGDNSTTSTPISESTTASGHSSADDASKNTSPIRLRANGQEVVDANSDDMIIEKMQAALESQEVEIVTLKEQLAIRSAEYAQLVAQYDPFNLQTNPTNDFKRPNLNNDAEMVAKSQLDLALYILHQRDMRCEEMTLELTSLMEERDTLQLKLSNTLRQLETIKAQNHNSASTSFAGVTVGCPPQSPKQNTSNISSDALNLSEDNELNAKLSQLQTVKHSRDKIIKEERDQRFRQMEQIQQDISKIPPAAVSGLIGNDLNRTTQSPSTTIFNWLWGTSLQTN